MHTIKVTRKRILDRMVLLLFSILVCELFLRLLGYYPLGSSHFQGLPVMGEKDSVRGWRPKPGRQHLAWPDDASRQFLYTVWPGGVRATSSKIPSQAEATRPRVAFFGCSFMYGWGLSDEETLPWMVREQMPSYEVVNYGTSGYGTYQNLLAMEEESDRPPPPSERIFIYGFSDFHEERNVADPRSIREWARNSTGDIQVPYCLLGEDGELVRMSPEGFPLFPLRQHSALVTLAEDVYVTTRGMSRAKQKREVTEALLLSMRDVAQQDDSSLVILLQSLQPANREHYLSFFKRNDFELIDGKHPNQESPDMLLPDGRHPNAGMNKYWAELVVEYLEGG